MHKQIVGFGKSKSVALDRDSCAFEEVCNRAIALDLDRAALVLSQQAALLTGTAQIAGEAPDISTSLSNLLTFSVHRILSLPAFHSPVTPANMAPKAGEKKPAQPAKKAVAKKSSAGRKKGSKKAVESYKIYIYKVTVRQTLTFCLLLLLAGCDCQLWTEMSTS